MGESAINNLLKPVPDRFVAQSNQNLETLLDTAKALIFDCDGTLVKTPDLYARGWQQAFSNAGFNMDLAWYHGRAGLSEHVLMDDFEASHGVKLDRVQTVKDLRAAILQLIDTVEEIPKVAAIARRYAGVKPMAVASGGSRAIVVPSLKAAGLLPLFGIVVTIDDVENAKPAPDLFLEASSRIGIAPKHCRVFEDSPQGLQAARNAGMIVIDINEIT